ncbi:hypothetical protein Lal_00017730 [Lupinus albus]|uniref:Uncharacterized protein n=1 Tax=Lupinus albus TaxID=3870 RepID=A0A6A4QQR5_LUPAL|nr:hypothetical protein Lalb_Chr04g0259041 [Lupinus albus]KAF1870149.1 hypothetical protein Lal_00017730 [Lupinus albus]
MRGSKKSMKMKSKEEDEVEQLLQATQDHFLLNLSLNSHTTRSSPSLSSSSNNYDDISLDLDLERRFHALKGKTSSQSNDQELNSVLGQDLSARFAALKGKSSSSHDQLRVGPTATALSNVYEEESEDEEDQVQKLIDWAKDAARLDPSPPSDEEEEEDDDSDEDEDNRRRKRK